MKVFNLSGDDWRREQERDGYRRGRGEATDRLLVGRGSGVDYRDGES